VAGPSPTEGWQAAGLSYHALSFFYQRKFGIKVRKISLDAGFSCPNRDGTIGRGGCIFCDPESFSPSRRLKLSSLGDQIDESVRRFDRAACGATCENPPHLPEKDRSADINVRFIAYFQPATNTYAPVERLRQVYEEALAHPQIIGLAVGTRPDCVSKPVLDLLAEFSQRAFLLLEYGLQTIHDRSLKWMNRGHRAGAFLMPSSGPIAGGSKSAYT
jgi:uncharacterized protein